MQWYTSFLTHSLGINELIAVEHKESISTEINADNPFIIAPGLGRTGTTSLNEALSHLGIECYQLRDAFTSKMAMDIWMEISKQKLLKLRKANKNYNFDDWNNNTLVACDWNKFFNGYNGCCGTPTNAFFVEILDHYTPNYKVILTVRNNENVWYQSIINTVYPYLLMFQSFVFQISPKWSQHNKFIEDIYLLLFRIKISDYKKQELYLKKQYNEWSKLVQKYVPKDKLLLFNCQNGWDPLCTFLNKEIPKNVPFPRANQRKIMMKVNKNGFKTIKMVYIVITIMAVALVGFVAMLLIK